ncbi:hypothetical protein ACFXG8_24365 [Kitasatospora indigofera]|uniref:hypothetical protein n=1 Tax=Kitasatospora indigofera TaxID=67307 RepID=UPI0036B56E24
MRVRSALLSMSILTALLATVPSASASVAPYDGQASHSVALFSVKKPNNTAVQEFITNDSHLDRVSLYIGSAAGSGTITVSVRAVPAGATPAPANATTTIATKTLTIDSTLADQGWLEVPLDAAIVPGQKYYLFAEAASNQAISWSGVTTPVLGSLSSWNYDATYYGRQGGWNQEKTYRLAFYVNPSDSERCGSWAEKCYHAVATGLVRNSTTTAQASGSRYVDHSNVLARQDGTWSYLPTGATAAVSVAANDPGALTQIAESKAWLDSGKIPGAGPQRDAAERALLSMRALTQPNGAVAAAWGNGYYEYSWPRDSSFISAAFAATGHDVEAYQILKFNATTQSSYGTWEARYNFDTSMVRDGRHWQLDANGWVPWSAYQWYQAAPQDTRMARLTDIYPMIKKAADYTAAHLDANGLPPASPDYWELASAPTANISTAAPLLAGLNAAAELATQLQRSDDATRYTAAARQLSDGIAKFFAPNGYMRSPDPKYGHDSAATFMAPPFNAAPADLAPALDSTYTALRKSNGGLLPGDGPEHSWGDATWTPSTSFFALAWYGTGQTARADGVLDWVLAHRNALGELPEQVTSGGSPSAMAPLAWTDSLVLMSLLAKDGTPLPTPPSSK